MGRPACLYIGGLAWGLNRARLGWNNSRPRPLAIVSCCTARPHGYGKTKPQTYGGEAPRFNSRARTEYRCSRPNLLKAGSWVLSASAM
jgi:hypothetical protein